MPVFESKELFTVLFPAAGLSPEFRRKYHRHKYLLRTCHVHFLTNYIFDFSYYPVAKRKIAVNAGSQLSYHAGPQHKPVADNIRLSRIFHKCWYQEFRIVHICSTSLTSASTSSSSLNFLTTSPPLKRSPAPFPPAIPTSDSLPSPMPFTTHPSMDTLSGRVTKESLFSTSTAIFSISISILPHVGQEIILTPLCLRLRDFNIS